MNLMSPKLLDPNKFKNPKLTAKNEARATVALKQLETLWVNTGTLCNITCAHCYIESSPKNDRLVYFSRSDLENYLNEIQSLELTTHTIGFTGGEPMMNPEIIEMLELVLSRGYQALVLTNAMQPLWNKRQELLALHQRLGAKLRLRVSVDHPDPEIFEAERGAGSFAITKRGLKFLAENGFNLDIAGRIAFGVDEQTMRQSYLSLFDELGMKLDVLDPVSLMLFPEMDENVDVPEITEACWGILKKSPDSVMCATTRMVVKRKGASAPAVLACTLIPYDPAFELGTKLGEAMGNVPLNHPHCAKFCVLGGAACSR